MLVNYEYVITDCILLFSPTCIALHGACTSNLIQLPSVHVCLLFNTCTYHLNQSISLFRDTLKQIYVHVHIINVFVLYLYVKENNGKITY